MVGFIFFSCSAILTYDLFSCKVRSISCLRMLDDETNQTGVVITCPWRRYTSDHSTMSTAASPQYCIHTYCKEGSIVINGHINPIRLLTVSSAAREWWRRIFTITTSMANSWANLPGQGHTVWKTGNPRIDWHRARPRGCDNPEQGTGTLTHPRVTVVAPPLPDSGARYFHRPHATGPLSLISDNEPRLGSSLHGIQHSITVKITVLSVFRVGHSATSK